MDHRLAFACVSLAATLAGCGSDPRRVMNEGERREFIFAATPHAVAECAAGNARSFSMHYTATVSELTRPDNFQVVVTKTDDDFRPPLVIARSWPSPAGAQPSSHLEVYMSQDLGPVARDDWAERLRRGC